jgi:hypothetical protein
MRRDLEKVYIPSCTDCLHNKSMTQKLAGPLHPLPIPDKRGDSVAMDFIGPLPLDENCDCILSMTDRLGSDIHIVPTSIDIATEDLALLFFNNWYCENGLPNNIVTDHNKLFVSKFWHALHNLTGVKLKLSSAYHLETDGTSEHSNKTINQCVCYHVHHNQKGWVHTLPQIHFDIMNSVTPRLAFLISRFALGIHPILYLPLCQRHSRKLPLAQIKLNAPKPLLHSYRTMFNEAKDNLLQVKVFQAHYANLNRSPEIPFRIGNKVMLLTLHCCHKYK